MHISLQKKYILEIEIEEISGFMSKNNKNDEQNE